MEIKHGKLKFPYGTRIVIKHREEITDEVMQALNEFHESCTDDEVLEVHVEDATEKSLGDRIVFLKTCRKDEFECEGKDCPKWGVCDESGIL